MARLLKIIDKEGQIRIYLADTYEAVQEASTRHGCSATASAALGRSLTAALMMGSDLKSAEDSLTLRIRGNGPGGEVVVTATADGTARGYILNPKADLPSKRPGKLDVGGLVGHEGTLEVIRDMGMEQPFIGHVELVSGEIAEDMAEYFYHSEQVPSLVSLGVLVDPDLSIHSAQGLFVQAMPGASDAILMKVEEQVKAMGPISSWMDRYGSLEVQAAEMLKGIDYEIIKEMPLAFQCNCSRERLKRILTHLDPSEFQSILDDGKDVEVLCHFCNEKYVFTLDELIQANAENNAE